MNSKAKMIFFTVVLSFLVGASGMYVGMDYLNEKGVGHGAEEASTEPETTIDDEVAVDKFMKAFQLISEQYVEGVDERDLLEGAIEGMLNSLEDPYSVYMDQESAKSFEEALDSHFEGIGAEVSMTNGQVTIIAPIRDTPAERSGLLPNDRIVKIDGETTEGLSLYEAVNRIRGEKGTIVELTINRPGTSDLLNFEVERDTIPFESVRTKVVEHKGNNIGVLEITRFAEETAVEFKEGLQSLESQGIDGLVIDVRGNPGGYLNVVDEIGKLIIPHKKPIVQIEGRDGEKVRYLSSLDDPKEYPIVGLIDQGSASASEILAAALKEAGDYELVGQTTFGKGTVQQAITLGDGSQIKLSLFKWLTSDGNFINKIGVEPTVEVSQPEYFFLPPLNTEEDLKFDMIGEQVRNAQLMLKGLGFEPGRTDGYFGEQTVQAVKAFQEVNSIEATGEIDSETATFIHGAMNEVIRNIDNDRQMQTAFEIILKSN
ncbi:S41 family peptidase [Alkalihalobacterium alkalicellulosilyticum]|uniref:S41 family peptidase n=1 Tax=Alkalihalobacterium alkalicellulosilyticum TaxID=1912214 RepID=UPI0009979FA0|nr:S41 family peptidase [Bacillus alkalicellulosilyticus]